MALYLVAVTFGQMRGKGIGIGGQKALTTKWTRCFLIRWTGLSRALACMSYISRVPRHGCGCGWEDSMVVKRLDGVAIEAEAS